MAILTPPPRQIVPADVGILVPFTGNLLIGGGVDNAQVLDISHAAGPFAFPFGINFTPSLSYNGTQISTLGSITGGSGYASGTALLSIGTITGGSGYVAGSYLGVAITDSTTGAATGATANVVVNAAGAVATFAIANNGGNAAGYLVGDTLTVSNALLGGSGTGFSVPVATTGARYTSVPFTGGTGTGATGTITVLSTGTAITAASVSSRGLGYTVGDVLSVAAASVGGTGSGFSVPVGTAGAPSAASNSWLYSQANISGGPAIAGIDGLVSPLHFLIAHDTVTSSLPLNALSIKIQPDVGHTGNRIGVFGWVAVVGAPGSGGTPQYAGIEGQASTGINLGGTDGSLANARGFLFGGNSNAFTSAGATFLNGITSWEFDTTLVNGASAGRKHGIMIVKGATDRVRGTYEDSAIEIADQTGAGSTWLTGLEFGSYSSQWAFGADSTLIGVTKRTIPSVDTPIAMWGVDFSNVTFTTGGAGLRMPLITPASSSATGSLGAMVWDGSFIYICTATNTWKRATLATF